MIKYLFIVLLSLLAGNSYSQQTIATTGGDASGAEGSISYTIGQIDYLSAYSMNGSALQGVQQPKELYKFYIGGNIVAPTTSSSFNKKVPNVWLNVAGNSPMLITNSPYNVEVGSSNNMILKASKNNDINKSNGVNSLDIALIQSHILGKTKLNSPYKIIAADVNGDGKVNSLDIVYIKRLILGLDTTFTNTITQQKRLWAFVDSSYQFADATKPFPYKDSISFTGLNVSKTNQTFIGCKLGDVNWDWNPAKPRPINNNLEAVELSYEPYNSAVSKSADQYIHIPVKVKNFKEMQGMQFTLSFNANNLQWQGVGNNTLGLEMGTNHATEGSVSFVWVDAGNEIVTLEDGSVLMELVFKTIHPLSNSTLDINSAITDVAAYDKDNNEHNIVMKPSLINTTEIVAESWNVSPNPVTGGVLNVKMNLKDKKTVVLRLLDPTGKVLLVKQVEGVKGANHFTLREGKYIPSGTYYLQAVGVEGVKQLIIDN